MSPGNARPSAPVFVLLGEALEDVFPGEPPVAGGAPLNVACHLRALGAQPLLVTRLGLDAGGERLMHFLQAHHLSTAGLQHDREHPTGRVLVTVEGTGTRFEIPFPQAFDFLEARAAEEAAAGARPAAVYFGTLAQRGELSGRAIRGAIDHVHALRFCDLNLRDPWAGAEALRASLARAEVLKLNDDELHAVVGRLGIPGERNLARALLTTYPVRTLIVTEGERGARRLDRVAGGFHETRVAPCPVPRLVDTVGAGDGFAAASLLGFVLGWPAEVALARASALASALCGIRGAVPDDDAFYDPFRAEWGVAA